MTDIKDLDLYGLLDLKIDCSEQDIRSAYRKKALKCHPDKNPDDKKAAETFHLLSKAIEILLDKSARDAYDKVVRRKEEVKIRNSKLDSTRKKFKEDLERREREAEESRRTGNRNNQTEEEILQKEIDRLRKEGSIRLQEEIKLMTDELKSMADKLSSENQSSPELYRLRIKWKSNFQNEDNVAQKYNEQTLTKIFSKYGEIGVLVVSNKKQGSALIEYKNVESAKQAIRYERGFPNNPLIISYLNAKLNESESTNTFANCDMNVQTESMSKAREDANLSNLKYVQNTSRDKSEESLFSSSSDHANAQKSSSIFSSVNTSSNIASGSIFPSVNVSSNDNMFPSVNSSSSIFSSASMSSNIFPCTNSSSSIFPSASMSSNIFPSTNKISSNFFSSCTNSNRSIKVKVRNDLDYEEKVLLQMRKAQEKQ